MKASPSDRLDHIARAITNLEELRSAHTSEQISASAVLRAALERFLEVISEASRHLPDEWKEAHPSVPWRDVAAIGNVIRHAYDGVDVDRLLLLVSLELPALSDVIRQMRARLEQ